MERPVRTWGEKNRLRRERLESLNADVWVLTETHDDLDLTAAHTAVRTTQRYTTPGGRWTTIWTTLPIIEQVPTTDPSRCVAVRLDAGEAGELLVYGTVLPWNGDAGPAVVESPARGWTEFYRVVPEQAREWRTLRAAYPHATVVVAGDLNHDLGGEHYYGTKAGRTLLTQELAGAGLECLTTTNRFDRSVLLYPPIDHICVGAGHGATISSSVEGWDRAVDGVTLTDHGGTLASITVARG